jgi:[acyl-carrier-protein] S-malonyltransferase
MSFGVERLAERVAFVFPGQGSQFVGMGKALYGASARARRIFDQADEALGFSLSHLAFHGPAAELDDTVNTQPAILTVSVAALEALREKTEAAGGRIAPVAVAGHSLGEFTALVAADVLDFPTALHLVRERGRLMKEAGQERPGGMAAVIGLDDEQLAALCDEAAAAGVITIANANCPGQTVISGEVGALQRAMDLAVERGARKVARLGISIASHSPLMGRASVGLGEILGKITLRTPQSPVVANADGKAMTTVEEIRHELADHVERPVNWTRSVREMIESGASTFVEIGPGQVLSGLIRRINRDVATLSLADFGLPEDRPARAR